MRRALPLPTRNGFTLVELLVALFVFGLLATAGVYLLSSSADGQAVLSERLAENGEMIRAATLLRADLAGAIDRPSRSPSGARLGAFVTDGGMPGGLFALSSLSAPEEDGAARADVERIGYAFRDKALMRFVWAMPDGSSEPVGARLVEGLGDVAVRYRDDQGAWSADWTATPESALPRAIEMVLTSDDGLATRIVATVGPRVRPLPLPEPDEDDGGTDGEGDADAEGAEA